MSSVEYFRSHLSQKTKQLEELCEHWSNVLATIDPNHTKSESSPNHNNNNNNNGNRSNNNDGDGNNGNSNQQQEQDAEQEDLFGAIRTTIGQAKLLMSQRFKQFSDLIDNCEFNTGQHPTTLNDLAGFWEMIGFQIDDVSEKFKSLIARANKVGCQNWAHTITI